MKSIKDIRRENLRTLAKSLGSMTALGERADKDSSQVAQLIGKTPTRNVGEALAREFEERLGLERYWLDKAHDQESIDDNAAILKAQDLIVRIPLLDVELSAGSGNIVLSEQIEDRLIITMKLLQDVGAREKSCCVLTVRGECMMPSLQHGDLVMIDRAQTTVSNGKVYAIRLDGDVMIKRLFKDPNGIKIVADNQYYKDRFPDQIVRDDKRLLVIGRAIYRIGRL